MIPICLKLKLMQHLEKLILIHSIEMHTLCLLLMCLNAHYKLGFLSDNALVHLGPFTDTYFLSFQNINTK